jgi:hypothetical protein
MFFNLLIYLFVLLQAIQGVKSDINIDPISCVRYRTKVLSALAEIADMASFAYNQITNTLAGTSTTEEMIVVLNTLDSYLYSKNNLQYDNSVKVLQSKVLFSLYYSNTPANQP